MADIAALKILSSQIESFQKLPDPPDTLSDAEFDNYKARLEQSIGKGVKSVQDVSAYAENIIKKLDELKKCLPEQVKRIQDAIKALFGRLVVVPPGGTLPNENLKFMQRIHELEMKAKELMNHRLNELISETESVCARLKDGAALTVGDIDNLKGCLESWEKSKQESFDEEKRRKEEERRRKEQEERRRREENERRKQEEEERKRQEEEERKRREEEERRRREEEERQRKEEEERQRREEEERIKREKEERLRREAEDREKERQKKLDEEKLKREMERQRQDAEARERERRRKEEEERAKRKDPNNWEPIVYDRPCDEVGGKKAFHSGVCCMVAAPPGDIAREDVECNASDELDDVIEILDDGEKPASSIINIESKKGLLKSEVNPISPETIVQNAKDDSLWENVMSTSSMISISCQRAPAKEIEVDITHHTTASGGRSSRGKLYHMFTTRDKVWKFADMEYKGTKDVVSVTLPAFKDRFSLFELEMPANIPKETALKVAQSCHEQMFKSPVRMIVRQRDVDPQKALVMIAGKKHVINFIDQLKNDGYSYGPDVTKQFGLRDGQRLILTCAGNIGTSSGKNGVVKMTYYTYMNVIKEPLQLHVVDMYKQKDLQEYCGIVRLTVDNGTEFPDEQFDLTVTLPKIERQKTIFPGTRVRFPYYLTALAGFLSRQVCENDELSWKDVLLGIVGSKRELESLIRVAKRKVEDDNDAPSVCTVTLCDWMKATTKKEDKVYHILDTLDYEGLYELHNKCSAFVQFQKEVMTDTALSEISSTTSKSANVLAEDLHLNKEAVDRCKKECGEDSLVLHLLYEWRESDEAIKYGDRALDRLRALCGV
ncbi:RBP2A-like protein [Mya arenaria]|uniref:RBP2A-like protein n=1 Tax=Mya arenaria TaxID=6604 RepID=A0ABY7G230_MYAAR|nr:RBP2A-like protein [Mya arenaria]